MTDLQKAARIKGSGNDKTTGVYITGGKSNLVLRLGNDLVGKDRRYFGYVSGEATLRKLAHEILRRLGDEA